MPRPPAIPAADKFRIVVSILAGELTCAEARPARMPPSVPCLNRSRILRAALGEAHVELGVWKRSAEAGGAIL
ncbi:MAG: hypothetical protein ACRDPK_13725 [Carbonactinosporaceae bacterium]